MKIKTRTKLTDLHGLVGKHGTVKHGWQNIPCIVNKFELGPDGQIFVYVETPDYAGIRGWGELLKRNIKHLTIDTKQPEEIKRDQAKIDAAAKLKAERAKYYSNRLAEQIKLKKKAEEEAKIELEKKKKRKDKV